MTEKLIFKYLIQLLHWKHPASHLEWRLPLTPLNHWTPSSINWILLLQCHFLTRGSKTCINRQKRSRKQRKKRWEEKQRRGSTKVRGKGQAIVHTSTTGNAPSKSCAVRQQGARGSGSKKNYDSWHFRGDCKETNCTLWSGRDNLYLYLCIPLYTIGQTVTAVTAPGGKNSLPAN